MRFLTPIDGKKSEDGIYTGWLDGSKRKDLNNLSKNDDKVTYADGLSYNLNEGWYEFRCSCNVTKSGSDTLLPLPEILGSYGNVEQPFAYEDVVSSYLLKSDGGDLSDVESNPETKSQYDTLVKSISTYYARMVAGDGMLKILEEMGKNQGMFEDEGLETSFSKLVDTLQDDSKRPLHYRPSPLPNDSNLLDSKIGKTYDAIRAAVFSEVASVSAIDLHTHLLPPSHGALCLWGIDELLTYVCHEFAYHHHL